MFGITGIFKYISMALGAALIGLSVLYFFRIEFFKGVVSGLEDDIVELKLDLRSVEINKFRLEASIDELNKITTENAIDAYEKNLELDAWKAKPEKIRYNTIYKYLDRNITFKDESCENTRTVIDAIRNAKF